MVLFSSRIAAAAAAGVAKDTWRRVEEGQSVQDTKLAQISRALGWTASSGDVVAEGGEPILTKDAGKAAPAAAPPLMAAEEVRGVVLELARDKLRSTPIGDLDDFSAGLVEVLRRAGMVKDGD